MGKVVRDLVEYNGISYMTDSNQKNFRQMNVDYKFCIPDAKPNIKDLNKVWIEDNVLCSEIVKTPIGTSFEGQVLTGYKLLVTGEMLLKVEYIACNALDSVHTAHTTVPFCGYLVLPDDTNPYSIIRGSVIIEDVIAEKVDCRCIYVNVTMALTADTDFCRG